MTNALPPDPWKVLGLEKSADKAEIRTVYKKLVLKCHPDKVQDPKLKAEKQEEFQRVQQAYELLNDDAALAKYEAQVRLQDLRKQHASMKQNMANTSAPRSSPRTTAYAAYDIRTAEPPRFRRSSTGVPLQTSSSAKMYTYSSSHSRSHEDMPSSRRPVYEEDSPRSTRRTASYDYSAPKSSKKTEERRDKDDRRRRREDDIRDLRDLRERPRSRELSRERERDRVERKEKKPAREKEAKERDKDRKPKQEDKTRRAKEAYVEDHDDEFDYAPKLDRKPSSGRKEEPTREKTSSRRTEATTSPRRESSFTKSSNPHIEAAFEYITRSRGPTAGPFRQPDPKAYSTKGGPPPLAPTPPPPEDDFAASHGAARRASPDRAAKSPKEKTASSSHKKPVREFDGVNIVNAGSPPKDRVSPGFKHSPTMPTSPDPPQPIRRSQTEAAFAGNRPPAFHRAATFHVPESSQARRGLYDDHEDVAPAADDRHRRRTRRARSPEPHTRYKVDTSSLRTMKLDTSGAGARAYLHNMDARSPLRAEVPDSSYAGASPFGRVKESRHIDPRDIKYSQMHNVTYGDFADHYRMTTDPHSYGGYTVREPYPAMA